MTRDEPHRIAAFCLAAFTVFSWAGYAVFVRHPENLGVARMFPAIFNYAFSALAQAHVVLSFVVVASSLRLAANRRWLGSFAAVFAVCLLAELGGTTLGIPFGRYAYTSLLGYKLFGHVPVLIPVSWFAVAACGHAVGAIVSPGRALPRVLITALSLVFWDLSLDPAMSYMFSYWNWIDRGDVYYGMPLLNIWGWLLTGFTVGVVLEWTGLRRHLPRLPLKHWLIDYGLVVSLSLGFTVLGGLWAAAVASALAYGSGIALWRLTRFEPLVQGQVRAEQN